MPSLFRFALRLLLLCLCLGLGASCLGRHQETPLPSIDDLERNRLVILLHGYISESQKFTPLFDALYRDGISPEGQDNPQHFHTHHFDFSRFTRVGSDHNASIENLAAALSRFYHGLPKHCPICAERAQDPVEVTVIARSLGGIVAREFLLQEYEAERQPKSKLTGDAFAQTPWRVERMITLGSPFYGSTKTLYSRGFLSILINGVIRTGFMGFFNPEGGGAFGNVIDAQARAIRFGSVFLWNQHMRWRNTVRQRQTEGLTVPPWLVVAGVGHLRPQVQGDAVTRFPAANIATTLPDSRVETLITDLRHQQLFRSEEPGRIGRELDRLSKSIRRFIEYGTLGPQPHAYAAPWMLTDGPQGPTLLPVHAGTSIQLSPPDGQRAKQLFYLQPHPPHGDAYALERKDLQRKLTRLDRLFSKDQADVWLRFYDGLPGDKGAPPHLLSLPRHLSFFRNGIEVSRNWSDLAVTSEADADGQIVPTIHAMDRTQSHLITIPDLTPTGPYELGIRLHVPGQAAAITVDPKDIHITTEGHKHIPILDQKDPENAESPKRFPGAPFTIHPYQSNLVQIYLNGDSLRRQYPKLKELNIRELILEPNSPEPRP